MNEKVLSVLGLGLALAIPATVTAQPANSGRQVPACAAAVCEEEAAMVAALDSLLRHDRRCDASPPVLLRTLHLAPFTGFGDGIAGRQTRFGVPTSPAVARIDDAGGGMIRRYWDAIRIVSAADLEAAELPAGTCLVVFSPITWLGPDTVRFIVSQVTDQPRDIAQRFVFLERRGSRWAVSRLETGFQS